MVRAPSAHGLITTDPSNFRFRMHSTAILIFSVLATTGAAMAGVPQKAPLGHYQGLWHSSPFTSPPTREIQPALPSLSNDLTLGGVSPIPGGYRVTILTKGSKPERITLDSGKSVQGLRIGKVEFHSDDPLETIVHISSGDRSGQLRFDRSSLVAKPPSQVPAPPVLRPAVR